jgi:hypothetical protein
MPVTDFAEPQVEQEQQTYTLTFQKKKKKGAEEICNELTPVAGLRRALHEQRPRVSN